MGSIIRCVPRTSCDPRASSRMARVRRHGVPNPRLVDHCSDRRACALRRNRCARREARLLRQARRSGSGRATGLGRHFRSAGGSCTRSDCGKRTSKFRADASPAAQGPRRAFEHSGPHHKPRGSGRHPLCATGERTVVDGDGRRGGTMAQSRRSGHDQKRCPGLVPSVNEVQTLVPRPPRAVIYSR